MRALASALTVAWLLCSAAPSAARPRDTRDDARAARKGAVAKRRAAARKASASASSEPESARARPISLALTVGYGFSLEDAPHNPWGVGFGARGGYNLDALFIGARFVFYAGEEPSNIWEIGLETGFDLKAGLFTARPGVGVGIANVTIELGPTAMDSETEVYIAPGVTLLADLAADVFVGAEGRVQVIFAEPTREAVIVLGTAGMRF